MTRRFLTKYTSRRQNDTHLIGHLQAFVSYWEAEFQYNLGSLQHEQSEVGLLESQFFLLDAHGRGEELQHKKF